MIEFLLERDGGIPLALLELLRPLPITVRLRNARHHLWRRR